jgi:hypothetical protein
MMAQNREAPAFQEYAAQMMARTEYRVLSLAARGLLYSVRLECWVNRSMPANPSVLARVIGFEKNEVEDALPQIMPFLAIKDGQLFCPELDDYRAHLACIRAKQSEGGKHGAAATNGKRKPSSDGPLKPFTSNPRVTRDSTRESLVKSSPDQSSQTQPLERDDIQTTKHSAWIDDYERISAY